MKKTLAILLALALVFSSITVSFAAETLPVDAQACVDLGMVVGDGTGVTQSYLNSVPTRIQAAVMVLNLKGLTDEAKAFTGTANFADADKAAWAKPIMAYLKANPSVGYQGDGTNFNPTANITAKEYYVVMLTALGYKSGTDFTWDNAMTVAAEKGLKAVAGVTNFTVNDLATATVETLKANVAGGTTTLAAKLVADKVITAEAAAKAGLVATAATGVESAVAKSASSFVVKFNGPVADTTKATITVKRNSVATPLTTAWNEGKTEATLTYAGILPEGEYTAAVTVDGKDFGSKTVTITKQKVAKIEILGTQLAATAGAAGHGYAAYQVFDQYGVDITKLPMANGSNLTITSSVGQIVPSGTKNGVIELEPFTGSQTLITQFPTATLTIICPDSAVSVTKTLTVSLAQGTLSEISLNKVVNVDNKEIVATDRINKFYIDYTATDINGNPTKNMSMVKAGLMLYGNILNPDELLTTDSQILKAHLVQDPADSTKAVIELEVVNGRSLFTDTQVIVTAMTKSGKSSSITVNVKKESKLDRLTLLTPSVLVADDDTDVEIPYEAVDQNGNILTKYEDILGTYSGGRWSNLPTVTNLTFSKNTNGTLKITTGDYNFNDNEPAIFQVVTSTGKSSMITIRPDDLAVANDLAIDPTEVTQYMQLGAKQGLDFGPTGGYAGLKVLDQYGRSMNIVSASNNAYYVRATSSTPSVVSTAGTAWGGNGIVLTASTTTAGSATVVFDLMKNGDSNPIATRSMTFSVIPNSDIVGLSVDAVPTMYAMAVATGDTATVAQMGEYDQDLTIYGKVSNGGLVTLDDATAKSVIAFVNNSDFTVADAADGTITVGANKLPVNVAESNGSVTTSLALNNTVYTATTALKSTSAAPVVSAVSVSVSVANAKDDGTAAPTGFTVSGDTVTGTIAAWNNVITNNLSMVKFNGAGLSRAKVYFRAKDQYGAYGTSIPVLQIIDQSTSGKYTIDTNGELNITGTLATDDYFTVQAVANNGTTKVIKFVVK